MPYAFCEDTKRSFFRVTRHQRKCFFLSVPSSYTSNPLVNFNKEVEREAKLDTLFPADDDKTVKVSRAESGQLDNRCRLKRGGERAFLYAHGTASSFFFLLLSFSVLKKSFERVSVLSNSWSKTELALTSSWIQTHSRRKIQSG